jgi:ATP phosphoribosyltransferase regulatory subunit
VLALGHVGVFAGLLAEAGLSTHAQERLRERVDAKDPAGVAEALGRAGVGGPTREAVLRLTSLGGDAGVLDEASRAFADFPPAVGALGELRETVDALQAAGLGGAVTVDLAEVRGLDYYTGLVFRVYAPDLGFELGAGGRYDTLLARFGRPMPAVGFMLGLDRVALLLERQAPAATATAAAEGIDTSRLGAALVDARTRRASGRRVRCGTGGGA